MKKEELLTALRKLKKCMDKKTLMPILDNILNNMGTMTVSRLDCEYTVNTGFNGKFLIPFTLLEKIVNKLPKCAELDLDPDFENNKVIILVDNGGKFTLPMSEIDDFPELTECKFSKGKLTEAQVEKIAVASKFIAHDELRPVMNAVLVGSHIVSSDAHRLVYFSNPKTVNIPFLISDKALLCMNDTGYDVLVNHKNKEKYTSICLKSRSETITFRAVEGSYPNCVSVIPSDKQMTYECHVSTDDLIEKMNLVNITANTASGLIKFAFDKDHVIISSHDIDFDISYSDSLPVDCVRHEEDITIGFKYDFLISLLKISGPTVRIRIKDRTRAVLLDSDKLLMPMKINE